jgi:NhaP-type Na+/H+ or K+/H+ antiporter
MDSVGGLGRQLITRGIALGGEDTLVSLASIVVLGIGAQWIAWRLRLPSILLLLLAGFLAGPVTGLLDPDHLLGETLFPIVSISVGIILFEGGLTLQRGEIEGVRQVVLRLVSAGALVTWVIGTLGAYFIVGLDFGLSLLVGAIFIVSGPTVVIPLLNHVRPSGKVGSILKWEGIWIDPVGATIAVLVFEVILAEQLEGRTATVILTGLLRTVIVGFAVGVPVAILMIQFFKRYWVPEHLQNPVAVMLIVGGFALSNELQAESGLLATTLMGVILANQKQISVKHLSQFKEDIGVLLLSGLFIILAARIELESLSHLSGQAVVFLALMIVIARPLAVYLSTMGSPLDWRERIFLAWIAPRGIVAVSVASLFALELHETGLEDADMLVPLTFLIVVGTVAIYGLTAQRLACRLGLAQPYPEGILIVGAHDWAQQIAATLRDAGRDVLLVDTNWGDVSAAKLNGLPAVYASVLSEQILEEADMSRMGRLIALTRNDEYNSLATLRFAEIFGHANVFQVPLEMGSTGRTGIAFEQHGRCLFDNGMTHGYLSQRFESGATVKRVKLTDEFAYNEFVKLYGPSVVPMFMIDETGKLSIFSTDQPARPKPGHTLIALVEPGQAEANATVSASVTPTASPAR